MRLRAELAASAALLETREQSLKAVEGAGAKAAEEAAAGAELIAELEATLAARVGRRWLNR